jgi:hypothetical protein
MRYKITITMPKLSTAKKVYKLLSTSAVYNSPSIMHLSKIKEVCEECALRKED